jgi:ribose/xylose/arabinose/galactoside ABC-type transport system permease subunit
LHRRAKPPSQWTKRGHRRLGRLHRVTGVLRVLDNGLDHINIDSFLKILIRGLILLAALIVNVYAQRLRAESPKG